MLRRRRFWLLLAALLFHLFAAVARSAAAASSCPYDLEPASRIIPPACFANASAAFASAATSCCWYVYTAYTFAAVRHANISAAAFLPPALASACSASFAAFLIGRGLVNASLLSASSCDLRPSMLSAAGRPCQFPSVSDIRSAANFSRASRLCASPVVGDLSPDVGAACPACQNAVISATFALVNDTHTKDFISCGIAATIAVWTPFQPSAARFNSFARCMLQVLENVGGLGIDNLLPSPPPPSAAAQAPVSSPSSSYSSASRSVEIAAGSASAGLICVAAIVFLAFKIRRSTVVASKREEDGIKDLPLPSPAAVSPLPTDGLYIFTKAELSAATNGFDDRLILGEGGAGKVYLGRLPSGQPVAIKRIYRERKVAEFYAEVAILAKLRHRNLATLVGYCLGDREHVLVYEYMGGGNLARALSSGELTWRRRVRVALDVAEGLAYLHGLPEGAVIHRDVKPTNVLLTEAGLAKVSDFGVSRVVPPGGGHVSTEVVGTLGYVDPESFPAGHVSEATDVYSFGVVLLELVTGMRAVVPTPTGGAESIVHAARASAGGSSTSSDGAEPPIVDPRLGEGWDRATVGAVFELACRCVRPRKAERPTMREAAAELAAALADLQARTGEAFDDNAATSPPPRHGESPAPPSASTGSTTASVHSWSL